MEKIRCSQSAADSVDQYVEYRRIVGEDDGVKLFSEAEYEEYKRRVLPIRARNRLYVSFGVPGKIDCKLIGPETPCFCSHRFKQHQTDFEELPEETPIALPCRVQGCRCGSYQYVHRSGSQPVRCRCKHLPSDHSEAAHHLCWKCNTCTGFLSPYTCGCGEPGHAHVTLVETRAQREARGLPVGMDMPYAAMGGLTGFSSLAEGYLRLDPSGSGLSPHDVSQPSQAEPGTAPEGAYGAYRALSETSKDLKQTGEDVMGYNERRHKERVRKEKNSKREDVKSSGALIRVEGKSLQL
ncbi:protein FAM221A [Astyanax mexicanus]|uniref:Protein FAM221A n=1 Tax=Astyanax mexicanus TaxID=7994 RepID=A0A8T2MA58_ASTMX|nr:protein FAM221A [Astyanax mexicanus]